MNLKNICKKLIAAAVLLTITNGTFAMHGNTKFILKNNSAFDIFCRCRSNKDADANINRNCTNPGVVKSGESIVCDKGRDYSIKTAGTSMLMSVSLFYDVPRVDSFARETLDESQYDDYRTATEHNNKIPIIYVNSGLTYGWKFTIGYTH